MAMLDDKVALIMLGLGHLAAERDQDAYLRGLVDLCGRATDAERATVYVVDHERHEVWSKIAQRVAFEIRLRFGQGLAGHVAATGETVNVPDTYADPRFDRDFDRLTGFQTLNALVVPVWSADARTVVGVIQVLNKRLGTFERRDQMLLERIAESVGPVLQQIHAAEAAN